MDLHNGIDALCNVARSSVGLIDGGQGGHVLCRYGLTEVGGISADGKILPNVVEWRLVDVPELGYLTSDKPNPRGELHIKTAFSTPGYYKRPEAKYLHSI